MVFQQLNFVNPNYQSVIVDAIRSYYADEHYLDVVFICKGGVQILAHKTVIASASSFLCDTISSVSQDTIYISLPDINDYQLRKVVNILYKGNVKLNLEDLIDLKELVYFLQINLNNAEVSVLDETSDAVDENDREKETTHQCGKTSIMVEASDAVDKNDQENENIPCGKTVTESHILESEHCNFDSIRDTEILSESQSLLPSPSPQATVDKETPENSDVQEKGTDITLSSSPTEQAVNQIPKIRIRRVEESNMFVTHSALSSKERAHSRRRSARNKCKTKIKYSLERCSTAEDITSKTRNLDSTEEGKSARKVLSSKERAHSMRRSARNKCKTKIKYSLERCSSAEDIPSKTKNLDSTEEGKSARKGRRRRHEEFSMTNTQILENEYGKNKNPSRAHISKLAKELSLQYLSIVRWFARKRAQEDESMGDIAVPQYQTETYIPPIPLQHTKDHSETSTSGTVGTYSSQSTVIPMESNTMVNTVQTSTNNLESDSLSQPLNQNPEDIKKSLSRRILEVTSEKIDSTYKCSGIQNTEKSDYENDNTVMQASERIAIKLSHVAEGRDSLLETTEMQTTRNLSPNEFTSDNTSSTYKRSGILKREKIDDDDNDNIFMQASKRVKIEFSDVDEARDSFSETTEMPITRNIFPNEFTSDNMDSSSKHSGIQNTEKIDSYNDETLMQARKRVAIEHSYVAEARDSLPETTEMETPESHVLNLLHIYKPV